MKSQITSWEEDAVEQLVVKLVQMSVQFEFKQLPSDKLAVRSTLTQDLLNAHFEDCLKDTEYLRG